MSVDIRRCFFFYTLNLGSRFAIFFKNEINKGNSAVNGESFRCCVPNDKCLKIILFQISESFTYSQFRNSFLVVGDGPAANLNAISTWHRQQQ